MTDNPALHVYAQNAEVLAQRWGEYSPADVYAPVADLFPGAPCRIADIGAGPGRDAAWLAEQGHQVVAVEPVQAFRDMARAGYGDAAEWLDDRLPDLTALKAKPAFDLLLLSGVWHHIAPADRKRAMASVAAVLSPGGRVVISLRQGADDPSRGLYNAHEAEALDLAAAAGLSCLAQRSAGSIQPHNRKAGISWIWLVLWNG